ncbi:exodeoxyribonuclease VII large subunit [Roseateles toxinivorans]|uniref:Exodeoxyribonuclease 7 large subunit n=1 Tax=Roseateles toxinivorans TaxID=270368 RepID=A0A4V3CTX2_9BURK|nr:exodeoxyribonuclease VII large subunit [Roseateles toxinivorans]TDP74418.1 exodeoxyribonuclease VII large subunit [Roseateles toxinivorans]
MAEASGRGLQRVTWSVGALVAAVADALQARFASCSVEGELSGFSRASSGHCYFTLKDADGAAALVRCAMFKRAASLLDFAPADGQRVELRGRLAVYEPRGELQLVVEAMRRAGAGALYEQFLRLKAKLEAQGLFDASVKRALPAFPQRIGVVTSRGAAALHDVLTALKRRAPHVEVIVYPSLVQGAEAPEALVRAIQTANERAEVDVLIVCRGGGSLEDLWAFNDERVVRAIATSGLVVACGVGHETDVTLADLAADLRAPTPTAAAELVSPSRQANLDALGALAAALTRRIDQRLEAAAQRLDRVALRLARPADALASQQQRLAWLSHRLSVAVQRSQTRQAEVTGRLGRRLLQAGPKRRLSAELHLDALEGRLRSLDPRQVLARGFAWLDDGQGNPLSSVAQLHQGQDLHAVLADGQAQLQVRSVLPDAAP